MKKRLLIICIVVALLLVIPIPTGVARDGGTKTYTALTYKIVDWNHDYGDGAVFDKTKVYFFPNNFASLDELIEQEIRDSTFYITETAGGQGDGSLVPEVDSGWEYAYIRIFGA